MWISGVGGCGWVGKHSREGISSAKTAAEVCLDHLGRWDENPQKRGGSDEFRKVMDGFLQLEGSGHSHCVISPWASSLTTAYNRHLANIH